MAKVGAQRAAELTGRSKSTIQRAMKSGKLSYEVDNNDRRVIDVAELDRAFGLLPQDSAPREQSVVEAELEKASNILEIERLKMRIKMLEDQLDVAREHIEDIKGQRDQWQKQAQQVLLTSQYSQKQAEELKEELKEHERRARARRQQEMERRMHMQAAQSQKPQPARPAAATATKAAAPKTTNENRQAGPIEKLKQESKNLQGLWTKFRGSSEPNATAEAAPAQTAQQAKG